jgi:hypothetical protein
VIWPLPAKALTLLAFSFYEHFGAPDSDTCTDALTLAFTANVNALNRSFTSNIYNSGSLADSPDNHAPIPAAA